MNGNIMWTNVGAVTSDVNTKFKKNTIPEARHGGGSLMLWDTSLMRSAFFLHDEDPAGSLFCFCASESLSCRDI